MGVLVDGAWHPDTDRSEVESDGFDGWVGTDSDARFPVEAGRYHLYVSRACPWAHRTTLVRRLLGLEEVVSVDVVDPVRRDDGWEFSPGKEGCTPDTVGGVDYLRDVYRDADPEFTGPVTVPVLYDTERETIVNDESEPIARILATEFAALGRRPFELYPEGYRDEIDRVVDAIFAPINRGVYRAGFADDQATYEDAVETVFDALERWDGVLGERRYLAGDRFTLADAFMFPTLFRFDAVYHTHFKCNRRRIVDFDHLPGYARDVYDQPGVPATCDLGHVREHYYRSHDHVNPTGLVAVGPDWSFDGPHDRDRLPGTSPASRYGEVRSTR